MAVMPAAPAATIARTFLRSIVDLLSLRFSHLMTIFYRAIIHDLLELCLRNVKADISCTEPRRRRPWR